MDEKALVVLIRPARPDYAEGMKTSFRANMLRAKDDVRTVQFTPLPCPASDLPYGRLEALCTDTFDGCGVGAPIPLFLGSEYIGMATVLTVLRAHWVDTEFIAHPEQPVRRKEWLDVAAPNNNLEGLSA